MTSRECNTQLVVEDPPGAGHHGGFFKYMKSALIPPAPWFILPLLIPIEFFSTFLVRPFSLAVRLFANMFAGHMLLLVFTLVPMAPSVRRGRLGDVSELVALVAMLPLLVFAIGLVSAVGS